MGTTNRNSSNITLRERILKTVVGSVGFAAEDEYENNPGDPELISRVLACTAIIPDNGDVVFMESNAELNRAAVEALECEQRDFPTKLVGFMTGFQKLNRGGGLAKALFNRQLDPAGAFTMPITVVPKDHKETGAIQAGNIICIKDSSFLVSPETYEKKTKEMLKHIDGRIKKLEKAVAKGSDEKNMRRLDNEQRLRNLLAGGRMGLYTMARDRVEAFRMVIAHEYCHVMLNNRVIPEFIPGETDSGKWQMDAALAMPKKLDFFYRDLGAAIDANEVADVTCYGLSSSEEKLCDLYALARYRPELVQPQQMVWLTSIFGHVPPANG
jgi:hypothetical protein